MQPSLQWEAIFGLITYKEGHDYLLTTEEIIASVNEVTPEKITIIGRDSKRYANAERAVYDMSTGKTTIKLERLDSYDTYYKVTIGGARYTLCTTEALPDTAGEVTLKSVYVSPDGSLAHISICNATYEKKTVSVNGVNPLGENLTKTITIEPESVGTAELTGVQLDSYTWTLG